MQLPNLPKKQNRKEAKIDGPVIKWFEDNWPRSCAIEVKVKGGKLKPHQLLALVEVQRGSFSFKIPDMGRKNPFDGFVLKNADAFVVECDGRICEARNTSDNTTFTFEV